MENKKSSTESDIDELKRVEGEFGFVRQYLSTMGNNDSEYDQLGQTFESYKKGEIGPDEAIAKAKAIQARKIER